MKFQKKICFLIAVLMVAMLCVMILPASADNVSVNIIGDKSRLKIEKNVFYDDEPIMVSAVGKGKDWIGLVAGNDGFASIWYYIDKSQNKGVGSGVTFNLLKSPSGNEEGGVILSPGRYKVCVYPNDQAVSGGKPVAYANIVVKERPGATPKVVKDAKYELENDTDGFAKGKITVYTDEDQIKRVDMIMYWGDENGKLAGYGPLARFRIKGKVTVANVPDGIIIPKGATSLLIYSRDKNGTETTKDCFRIELPANAAYKESGKPLFSYSVVSDVHITLSTSHTNNKNFKRMLEDVTALRPDSIGNFIVGDIADTGHKMELKIMDKIYKSVPGVANRYMCVGNHDMRDRTSAEEKANVFNQYITLPNGKHPEKLQYDFWLNGYHFIFLGTDEQTNNDYVMMNKDTLDWLDKTLAENYDPDRPAFIFLHQPLPNTIVGSLYDKYGQNWGNIDSRCEKQYREVLSKYPEAIMFNGHTHGILSSEANIYMGDKKLPTVINTGAVAYEWDIFDNPTYGKNLPGSEGYIVDVYEDKIILKGRDFETGEWVPNAQYALSYASATPEVDPNETETETPVETPAETPSETPVETPAETPAETEKIETPKENSVVLDVVLVVGGVVIVAGVIVAAVYISKKHKK